MVQSPKGSRYKSDGSQCALLNVQNELAGTDVVRIHDEHSVTLESDEGVGLQHASIQEAEKNIKSLKSVTFQSKPAIAPKGQKEMPFATVTFVFTPLPATNGTPACKV